jgi:hypothetical protein
MVELFHPSESHFTQPSSFQPFTPNSSARALKFLSCFPNLPRCFSNQIHTIESVSKSVLIDCSKSSLSRPDWWTDFQRLALGRGKWVIPSCYFTSCSLDWFLLFLFVHFAIMTLSSQKSPHQYLKDDNIAWERRWITAWVAASDSSPIFNAGDEKFCWGCFL